MSTLFKPTALSFRATAAATALLALQASPGAFAQQTTSQSADAATLGDVVVTASGFEQQLKDAPASITIVTGEELRQRSFRDLTDALKDVEGVAVTGTANESEISIRGMPGDYTLILVDGKRQSTRDARVNGSAGMEQSFIPPAEAIERIEVVRGPMSSLYGSDAIGGVINIITRKVPTKWGGGLSTDYTAQQHGEYGNGNQTQFSLGGPVKEGLLGLQMWGRLLNRQADDDLANGGYAKARHTDVTARLSLTPNSSNDIILQAGSARLHNGVGVSANWATREQDNDRDHASLTHKGRWGWAASEVSLAWEQASRSGVSDGTAAQNEFSDRRPEVTNTVFDAKLTMPWRKHLITTGVQWNDTALKDWNPGLNDRVTYTFGTVQKAVFVEDEWSLTDSLALTGGVRLDHHDKYGAHVNPRLYAVWHANQEWTIKGGVSRGFKTPELRAVIPDYGYLRRNRFVMLGNPDLKPESSINYELSTLWTNNRNLSGGVTVFYNDFKDKLSSVTTTDTWNGYIVMDRINIDQATIAGVELNGKWDVTRALQLKGNLTYTDSQQKSGANIGAPLALTPKQMANLRATWKANSALTAWSGINYYGKEYGTTLTGVPSPGYTTADIGAAYRWSPDLTLNAAVYNLSDKRLDSATYGKTNYGRRLWVSASLQF
ncbi:MAG: TonB-dependent receptor [Comamonas sp.]